MPTVVARPEVSASLRNQLDAVGNRDIPTVSVDNLRKQVDAVADEARGGPGRRCRKRSPCDLGHRPPAGPRAILAPSRSGGRVAGVGTMAADPYARIAELEAKLAAARPRRAPSGYGAQRSASVG